MPKESYRVRVVLDDRRRFLKLGAAGIASATLLPACDSLVLPELELLDRLPDIVSNEEFYVQSAFGTPEIAPESHRFRILAEGEEVARRQRVWNLESGVPLAR